MELKKQRPQSKVRETQSMEIDENGEECFNSANQVGLMRNTTTQSIMMISNQNLQIQTTNDGALGQFNKLRRNKIEEKRLFIMDEEMKECRPFTFEVDRGDGEKFKVLYSKQKDMFFQLQESLNECSLFVGKSIMKETRLYLLTEMDPLFFLIRALRFGIQPNQKLYQTLSQILDNILGTFNGEIASPSKNPFILGGTDQSYQYNPTFNQNSLKELLMQSARIRRSLAKVSNVKQLKLDENVSIMTYSFDEEKLIQLLLDKHSKIKTFLAKKYASTNRVQEQQTSGIVKNERKMKKEEQHHIKKEEESKEDNAYKLYEHMFETIAAGFVADELPKDLVQKFLNTIEQQEQSIYYGTGENKDGDLFIKGGSTPNMVDKKRQMAEISNNNQQQQMNMNENKNISNSTLKKKPTAKEQQQVKSGPINQFFKPKATASQNQQ